MEEIKMKVVSKELNGGTTTADVTMDDDNNVTAEVSEQSPTVSPSDINSEGAEAGEVLTANGTGGAGWQPGLEVGDIINLGTINVDSEGGTPTAWFSKEITQEEYDSYPDNGLVILMFNTTGVIFPYIKTQENRFVINASYDTSGNSMLVRCKLKLDIGGPNYIKVLFDDNFADALDQNPSVRPYGIIRFVKL